MNLSQFYLKTKRQVAPSQSINAYLLEKAGYIEQTTSGSYTLMPIGLRVAQKIIAIIRKEMVKLGASELLMSSLQPKSLWQRSNRWNAMDEILYKSRDEQHCFAPTHEELLTSILSESVKSYRDLPIYLFQFQTKFRREKRAKSGLLRGREFMMKDLYSLDADLKSHNHFYELVAQSYSRAFETMGLKAIRTKASGGEFSKEFSDEFQVICPSGEDEIWVSADMSRSFNSEIIGQLTPAQKKGLKPTKSIEVGNIFHLGDKYSRAFNLNYLDINGKAKPVIMGSYGIGIERLIGTITELNNDEKGLIWPKTVTPFDAHLIDLGGKKSVLEKVEKELEEMGFSCLTDDRDETAAVKMVDSDLVGIPIRIVNSLKTSSEGKLELRYRESSKIELLGISEAVKAVVEYYS